MGKAIFFFHYAAFTGNKLYKDFALDLIDDMSRMIHTQTPVEYANGLTGIGSGVEYLGQNGFIEADTDDVLEEIEERIHSYIPYETDETNLIGIGRYLLFRIRNTASEDSKLTTLDNKIFLIHILVLIERFYQQQSDGSIASIYRFLTEVDKTNLFPAKVKRLIRDIKSKSGTLHTAASYLRDIERTIHSQ